MTEKRVPTDDDSLERFIISAQVTLRKFLGRKFVLSSPREFPGQVATVPAGPPPTTKAGTKLKLLEELACVYALFVVIECSGRASAFYTHLRTHHGLTRDDGDEIMLVVRSVRPRAATSPQDMKRIGQACSEWATAIRYCIRKNIVPDQLAKRGMHAGEGISAWARKQRPWRQKMDRAAAGLAPQSLAKTKPQGRSVTELAVRLLKTADDRLLLEVGLVSANSSRVRVYCWKKLKPEKMKARTYVIPDLQRPFVWTPRQVALLIDSLFRSWPFGSLLLWEVKPDCFQENEGIPHRPFWQVIDRTRNDQGSTTSALGQPATYQMVLDGQQRVQSLILALGGDQWGFQLYDADWALDLQDRRVRPSSHWSKASLCVDLQKFVEELATKNDTVRKIEVGKILEWAILDRELGQSTEPRPRNYIHPLLSAKDNPGRFIRLSRFWDLVQKDLSEREYKKLLEPVLKDHGVDEVNRSRLLDPLAEFMKVVENVKTNSFVHALQIESFELTPQWTRDDYSDAIVNIFTRLNTAGRTLTREEITLAWLKIGWNPEQTAGKAAGQCLEELKLALVDRGFVLETDEIVRLISFIWSVEHRDGSLLDSKDLLKGDIVRSMAASVASAWNQLMPVLERGADLVKERNLLEVQESFNAVIVFLTWYRLVFDRFEAVSSGVPVVERDSLEKKLNLPAESTWPNSK